MSKYYFLGSAFPLLSLKVKSDLTYGEMSRLMQWNLTPKDQEIIRAFKTYIDLKNLKQLWLKQPLDPRGNLDEKGLNEALLLKDGLPEIVFEFLEKFNSDKARIKNFAYVLGGFFTRELANPKSDFLSFYFEMERSVILITVALRAKKLQRDLAEEFTYEDQTDFLVRSLLDQSAATRPELETDKMGVVDLFENNYQDPKKLQMAFLEYRFQSISDEAEKKPFSIDQILGYLAGIMLIEDLFRLSEGAGKKTLDALLR